MNSSPSPDKHIRSLDESEAKALVKSYGINVPNSITFKELPKQIPFDFPVVLKVSDPKVLHKTEVMGIALNIEDKTKLEHEFWKMKKYFPDSKFLVEKMEKGNPGAEVIIGVSKDSTFGLTIMFGLGGIYTELYKDIVIRVLPIDPIDANDMISGIKGAKLFQGFRNIKLSKGAAIDVLLKVARLAGVLDQQLYQLDLNPVLIRESDAVALDVKVLFTQ